MARGLTHLPVATRARRVAASAARGVDVPEAPLATVDPEAAGAAVVPEAPLAAAHLIVHSAPNAVFIWSAEACHAALTWSVQQSAG
jgi:hypothetical protein